MTRASNLVSISRVGKAEIAMVGDGGEVELALRPALGTLAKAVSVTPDILG
jgi:hypothetical protein